MRRNHQRHQQWRVGNVRTSVGAGVPALPHPGYADSGKECEASRVGLLVGKDHLPHGAVMILELMC